MLGIGDGNGNTGAASSTTDIESICKDDSVVDAREFEDVPPDLILNCANLSQHRSYNIPSNQEEIIDSPITLNPLDYEASALLEDYPNIPIDNTLYGFPINNRDMPRVTPIPTGLERKLVDFDPLHDKESMADIHNLENMQDHTVSEVTGRDKPTAVDTSNAIPQTSSLTSSSTSLH